MARVCETLSKQSVKRLFMNGLSAAAIIAAMRIPTLAPLVRAAAWCLVVGLAVPGMAAEQDAVRKSVQSGQLKPLNTIIADVSRQYGGRVLDVETKRGRDGDLQYEIKLINARGEKQELLIDAATGAVVPKERSRPVQPVTIAQMVQYVRKLEQSSGARVTNVDFERDAQGNYVYEAQLSDKPFGEVKLMLSVATGEVLNPVKSGAPAVQPKSMAVMLESLQARYNGRVLEAELETDARRRLYYSVELQQPNGSKLELEVDAVTLEVLRQKGGD